MSVSSAVQVSALEVRFPRFTLGPLSFELRPGDAICVIGLNASGKTTLLRTVAGRRERYEGSVKVSGIEVRRDSAAVRAAVGFLPDRLAAVASMRVREYLEFVSRFHVGWDEDYARDLCERLSVDADAMMGTLSKGTRVKVGLIAAESFRPPVLVLDEPTSGLDLHARQAFLNVVGNAVTSSAERALVFSTHVVDDAHRLATRVFPLVDGSLQPEIQPAQIDSFIRDNSAEAPTPRVREPG